MRSFANVFNKGVGDREIRAKQVSIPIRALRRSIRVLTSHKKAKVDEDMDEVLVTNQQFPSSVRAMLPLKSLFVSLFTYILFSIKMVLLLPNILLGHSGYSTTACFNNAPKQGCIILESRVCNLVKHCS